MDCFKSMWTLSFALLLLSGGAQAQQDFLLSAWSQVSSTTGIWQHWPHSGTWQHLPITSVNHPDAVTYDPVTERVIWSDSGFQNIQSAFLNGSGLLTLASYPGGNVQGLKVEPTSRLLYYSFFTSSSGELRTVHLDTLASSTVVTGLGKPTDLALDCPNGMAYYADGGVSPQAARVSVSGGAPVSLITSTSLGVNRSFTFTNGIALSPTGSMMYVCDTSLSSETYIYEVSLAAGAITRASFLSTSYCHNLETNGTHLFSANWLRGLQVAPLSSLNSVTLLHGQPALGRVMGLHYQHAAFTAGACPPTTSTTTTTTTSTTTTSTTTASTTTSATTTAAVPVRQTKPSSSSQYYTPFYAVTGVSAAGLTAVIIFVVIKKVVGKTSVTQLSHARPQNYQPQQRPGSATSVGSNVIGASNMAATHKAVHFQEAGLGSAVSLTTMAATLGAAGGAVVNSASWAQTSGHVKLPESRLPKPEPKVKVVKVKPKPQKNNWMK